MSNTFYLEAVIEEMRALLVAIATGGASLQNGDANQRYVSLRRRLLSLAPLIGGLAPLLEKAEDGWQFWQVVKVVSGGSTKYQARREYIDQEFLSYYKEKLLTTQKLSLPECLLKRDILLEEEIGKGGFGVVYRATHISLESKRAVKAFDPSFYAGEDKPLRRFAREAELLANLTHPNIVRFYDAGIAGRQPFIITEYIPGKNLQQIMNEYGYLNETQVVKVSLLALNALSAAHDAGVFHRDIKPSNIMWNEDTLKILDFGAGTALTNALTSRITTTAVGTPGFIAPELFNDPALLSPSPDIYSIAVMAHYLLTGRLPYATDPSYYLKEQEIRKELIGIISRGWVWFPKIGRGVTRSGAITKKGIPFSL